jgi:hypothetical protein
MKVTSLLVFVALVSPTCSLAGPICKPSQSGFFGGDGSTKEKAILICGKKTEAEGVRAERVFAQVNLPKGKFKSQSLIDEGEHVYDRYIYSMPDGSDFVIYFEITEFFGRR